MKKVTLLFLLRSRSGESAGQEILLAMKKRGVGQGKWNGIGGKVEPDESVEAATIRECAEEIGVTVAAADLEKVAEIDFRIPHIEFHNVAHVYFCRSWAGEPVETDEMAPRWFSIDSIPYEQMWSDDIFWVPRVLSGERFKARFVFDENEKVAEYEFVSTEPL